MRALAGVLMVFAALFDELCSGVPGFASPDIQTGFAVSYGQATGWILSAFMVSSVVLEPPLLLLADRLPRRPLLVAGVIGMAVCCLGAAMAPTYTWLLVSLMIWGPASGLATGVAQASLMDAYPDMRSRVMARWTLAGGVGDLLTPALFVGLVKLGHGWREAFLVCGVLLAVYAVFVAMVPITGSGSIDDDEDGEEPGMFEALRTALRNRRLLRWSLACQACMFLDELVISFGALHLRDTLGADEALRSTILGAALAGGIAGLLVLDAVLARVGAMKVLLVEGVLGCAAYGLWLTTETVLLSGVTMFFVGFSAVSFYPIAKAEAYASLPGQSGAVAAVASLFTVVEIVTPLALAALADWAGLFPVMVTLGTEPLVFLLIGAVAVWRLGKIPVVPG